MSRVEYGRTTRLDQDGVWVARAIYAADDTGSLTPIGLEVRPASLAAEGDTPWPPLSELVHLSDLPDTGFPLHLLRSFVWAERAEDVKEAWQRIEAELGVVYSFGADRVATYLARVANEAVARGHLKAGRRDLARSLFALLEASTDRSGGVPRSRREIVEAVRDMYPDFDQNELRAAIQWARSLEPPLFEPYGPRQRGGRLTPAAQRVLLLAEPLDVLEPQERDQIEEA